MVSEQQKQNKFYELLDRTLAKVRNNNNDPFTGPEHDMKGFLDEAIEMDIVREDVLYLNNNEISDDTKAYLYEELKRLYEEDQDMEEENTYASNIMNYISSVPNRAAQGGRRGRKTMRRGRKGKKSAKRGKKAKKSAKRGKKAKKSAKRGKKAKKSVRRTRGKNYRGGIRSLSMPHHGVSTSLASRGLAYAPVM